MRGAFRGAIKTCLQAIIRGRERNDFEAETRGWKLLLLVPRLLLARPPRGGLVPQGRLKERVARFWRGRVRSSLGDVVGVFCTRQCRKKSTPEKDNGMIFKTGLGVRWD